MPFTPSAKEAEFGIAKQSAEDTPAADPTYALPIFSGLPRPVQDTAPIAVTDTANAVPILWKTGMRWEAEVTAPVFPDSAGLFLKGILPTDTKTGASDPYTHEFTPTGTVPWFTLFSRRPGLPLYETFENGLQESVTIEFSREDPLKITGVWKGKEAVVDTAYTAGTTNVLTASSEYAIPTGAVLKWLPNGTPAEDHTPAIISGSVRISRSVEPMPVAGTLASEAFALGFYEVSVALDTVWESYEEYRCTFYGGESGSAFSPNVIVGCIDFLFPVLNDSNHSLQIVSNSVAMLVPEAPQPDAGGGPFKVSIDGVGLRPASGSLVTVTLKNAVSSAY